MYGQVLHVKRWQLVSSSMISMFPHEGQKNNIIIIINNDTSTLNILSVAKYAFHLFLRQP